MPSIIWGQRSKFWSKSNSVAFLWELNGIKLGLQNVNGCRDVLTTAVGEYWVCILVSVGVWRSALVFVELVLHSRLVAVGTGVS